MVNIIYNIYNIKNSNPLKVQKWNLLKIACHFVTLSRFWVFPRFWLLPPASAETAPNHLLKIAQIFVKNRPKSMPKIWSIQKNVVPLQCSWDKKSLRIENWARFLCYELRSKLHCEPAPARKNSNKLDSSLANSQPCIVKTDPPLTPPRGRNGQWIMDNVQWSMNNGQW
jgi:hypothetical protein